MMVPDNAAGAARAYKARETGKMFANPMRLSKRNVNSEPNETVVPAVGANAVPAGKDGKPVHATRPPRRDVFSSSEVPHHADHHADSGGAESPMPAHLLAQCAGNERRDDNAAVDKQIITLKSIGASIVTGRVKRANLAGEVALETTHSS